MIQPTKATYTKLNSGAWGVRIEGAKPQPGDTVTVVKRDGSRKTETIAKVVWSQGLTALCAIATSDRPRYSVARRAGRGGRYECDECGEYVTPGTRCWETGCAH